MNALLYGIPESNSSDVKKRIEQDVRSVVTILRSLDLSDLQVTKVISIGKQTPDKPRSVKVTFRDSSDAISFFKRFKSDSCKEAFPSSQIDVSHDRTPM